MADRTTGLAGTHVDSIFYCTWGTGLSQFTHISDIVEPSYAKTGVFTANRTQEFHGKGLDPLEIMVQYCQSNQIEIFWSLRMNDIHDSFDRWPELFSQFKKARPHLCFGTREVHPPYGSWSAWDYAHQEVRNRVFALFEDVCLRYDVDGIEMDFMRHLPHFKINGEGTDCTQKERNMMTKLLRRIRKMTKKSECNVIDQSSSLYGFPRLCPVIWPVAWPCQPGSKRSFSIC